MHLITTWKEIRTPSENVNFIFKNPADDDIYDFVYQHLPYVLLFMSHVFVGIFDRMQKMDETSKNLFHMRTMSNIAGEKRIVAGFVARMAMDGGNLERFFEIYPDGRHIAVLRDPRDWYVSARALMSEYGDVGRAVAIWSESARAMLRGLERYGPARVRVMRFEDLIGRTEPVMRSVAEFAGIDFDPVLLEPTFNGEPIRANSSFAVAEAGILSAPLERRTALSEDEREAIDREAGALHGQVCELALPRTPTGGGRPACEVTSG